MKAVSTMTTHEAAMYLATAKRSRPNFLRVEYTLCSGHFYIRGSVHRNVFEMFTRDSKEVRYHRSPHTTYDEFTVWLNGRTITAVPDPQK